MGGRRAVEHTIPGAHRMERPMVEQAVWEIMELITETALATMTTVAWSSLHAIALCSLASTLVRRC